MWIYFWKFKRRKIISKILLMYQPANLDSEQQSKLFHQHEELLQVHEALVSCVPLRPDGVPRPHSERHQINLSETAVEGCPPKQLLYHAHESMKSEASYSQFQWNSNCWCLSSVFHLHSLKKNHYFLQF